jgi:recombination protein RecA
VVKNKVAPPFKQAEFEILFNEGISKEGNLLDIGVDMNVIRKSGAYFLYGETRLGQGRENARNFLKNNPAIAQEIEGQIKANVALYKGPEGAGASASVE